MQCITGFELYRQYEIAETEKNEIKGKRLSDASGSSVTSKEFNDARQRYLERFADWLCYKTFCLDCRPKSAPYRPGSKSHDQEHQMSASQNLPKETVKPNLVPRTITHAKRTTYTCE